MVTVQYVLQEESTLYGWLDIQELDEEKTCRECFEWYKPLTKKAIRIVKRTDEILAT